METVETLIPDNEGNHLVVVLSFYEDSQKYATCATLNYLYFIRNLIQPTNIKTSDEYNTLD